MDYRVSAYLGSCQSLINRDILKPDNLLPKYNSLYASGEAKYKAEHMNSNVVCSL